MSSGLLKINLQVATEAASLPDAAEFDSWANAAAAATDLSSNEPDVRSLVTIRVVGYAESSALNGDFRNVDSATNVLAFPADREFAGESYAEEPELGDLAVCYDVVAREAQEQSKTLNAHMAHMIVHGTLHLLGYDHLETVEAEVMEALETRIMATLGFPDPYL